MHFDATITLGTIIDVVVFLAGLAILYGRLVSIETKLGAVWTWFESHVIQGERGERGDRGAQGGRGPQGATGKRGGPRR